jgi:hypothetical protein
MLGTAIPRSRQYCLLAFRYAIGDRTGDQPHAFVHEDANGRSMLAASMDSIPERAIVPALVPASRQIMFLHCHLQDRYHNCGTVARRLESIDISTADSLMILFLTETSTVKPSRIADREEVMHDSACVR